MEHARTAATAAAVTKTKQKEGSCETRAHCCYCGYRYQDQTQEGLVRSHTHTAAATAGAAAAAAATAAVGHHAPVSPVVCAEAVSFVVRVVALVLVALSEDLDAVALRTIVPPLTLVAIAVLIDVHTVALKVCDKSCPRRPTRRKGRERELVVARDQSGGGQGRGRFTQPVTKIPDASLDVETIANA